MSTVLPLFGDAVRGNSTLEIARICYSVLGNTEVRCDTGLSIDTVYVKQMSPLLPLLTEQNRTLYFDREVSVHIYKYIHMYITYMSSYRHMMLCIN